MKKTKKKKQKGSRALAQVRLYCPGVTQVVDANKSSIIEVTPRDSSDSTPFDHKECALARACKRSLHANAVVIGISTAYIVYGHKAVRFKLGQAVAREITSFDRRAGFSPGQYQLRPPTESEALGAKESGGKPDYPTGFKRKPFRHITANIRTILGARTETAAT